MFSLSVDEIYIPEGDGPLNQLTSQCGCIDQLHVEPSPLFSFLSCRSHMHKNYDSYNKDITEPLPHPQPFSQDFL